MYRLNRHGRFAGLAILCCCLAIAGTLTGGCEDTTPPPKPIPPRYPTLPPKAKVPDFMVGTVWERTDMSNADPLPISGYGLVVNLHHTGDSTASVRVRDYMLKQMKVHGYGSAQHQLGNLEPMDVLRDDRVAIVQVDGFLPVGARAGQRFDVRVSALRGSNTTSLAHGELYQSELFYQGAQEPDTGGELLADVERGSVFVNPVYALSLPNTSTIRASVRTGYVMHSGQVVNDRPIFLVLRQPQMSTSRSIEIRIRDRFQGYTVPKAAAAQDEGLVSLYVPDEFKGDWQHYVGVATHLYLNDSPEFAALQAQKLMAVALRPDAPLQDISYCLEGLGRSAVPLYESLFKSTSPDIQFAAARAAAFTGSMEAVEVLAEIARSPRHPFQLSAVQILGALPNSPMINEHLHPLINSEQTLVRLEAYRILAENGDPLISSTVINNEFALDLVQSSGAPLIYATRQGIRRIAIFGRGVAVSLPAIYSAMDRELTISSGDDPVLTLFYRGPNVSGPVKLMLDPLVPHLIQSLAGVNAPIEQNPKFNYGDIVAVLQTMADQNKLIGEHSGRMVPVPFVLQDVSKTRESIFAAPAVAPAGRPQGDDHSPATAPSSPSAQAVQ